MMIITLVYHLQITPWSQDQNSNVRIWCSLHAHVHVCPSILRGREPGPIISWDIPLPHPSPLHHRIYHLLHLSPLHHGIYPLLHHSPLHHGIYPPLHPSPLHYGVYPYPTPVHCIMGYTPHSTPVHCLMGYTSYSTPVHCIMGYTPTPPQSIALLGIPLPHPSPLHHGIYPPLHPSPLRHGIYPHSTPVHCMVGYTPTTTLAVPTLISLKFPPPPYPGEWLAFGWKAFLLDISSLFQIGGPDPYLVIFYLVLKWITFSAGLLACCRITKGKWYYNFNLDGNVVLNLSAVRHSGTILNCRLFSRKPFVHVFLFFSFYIIYRFKKILLLVQSSLQKNLSIEALQDEH